MKLLVLYFPHREGHNSIFPLLAYRSAMEEEGIVIRFFTSIDSFLSTPSDFLIVSGFSLPKLLKSKRLSIHEFLRTCHKRNTPLIYLSGSDSAGPFDQEVIKWVDVYLARQLVKDRSFHLENHRGHFFRNRYFLYQALLLMPDRTRLDTFPDFYSGDILIAYDWDAGHLRSKITEVLDNIASHQKIADHGYEKFE